jgi:hypothetical protein
LLLSSSSPLSLSFVSISIVVVVVVVVVFFLLSTVGGYAGAYLDDGLHQRLLLALAFDLHKALPEIMTGHDLRCSPVNRMGSFGISGWFQRRSLTHFLSPPLSLTNKHTNLLFPFFSFSFSRSPYLGLWYHLPLSLCVFFFLLLHQRYMWAYRYDSEHASGINLHADQVGCIA